MPSDVILLFALLLVIASAMLFGVGFIPDETYKGPVPERGFLLNKRRQLLAMSPLYRILNKILLVFAY